MGKRDTLKALTGKDQISNSEFFWIVNHLQAAWDREDDLKDREDEMIESIKRLCDTVDRIALKLTVH